MGSLHEKQHRHSCQPLFINSWAAVLHQLAFPHCIRCNILGVMMLWLSLVCCFLPFFFFSAQEWKRHVFLQVFEFPAAKGS